MRSASRRHTLRHFMLWWDLLLQILLVTSSAAVAVVAAVAAHCPIPRMEVFSSISCLTEHWRCVWLSSNAGIEDISKDSDKPLFGLYKMWRRLFLLSTTVDWQHLKLLTNQWYFVNIDFFIKSKLLQHLLIGAATFAIPPIYLCTLVISTGGQQSGPKWRNLLKDRFPFGALHLVSCLDAASLRSKWHKRRIY